MKKKKKEPLRKLGLPAVNLKYRHTRSCIHCKQSKSFYNAAEMEEQKKRKYESHVTETCGTDMVRIV